MKVLLIGADVDLYLNGQNIGRVEWVEFDSVTERLEEFGIDVPYPQELKAGRTFARVRLGVLRTNGDGGAQGMGAVAFGLDAAKEKYVTLLLRDRRFDQPLMAADWCQTEAESWKAHAKDVVRGTISLKVISWGNESSV